MINTILDENKTGLCLYGTVVIRKLAELGYHRSAKKCKEKFENVYKYHKRTKDGRTTKPDGKTYRFFEQLEALDTHPSPSLSSPIKPHAPSMTAGMLSNNTNNTHATVSSTPSPITTVFPHNATPIVHPINLSSQQPMQPINVTISPSVPSQSIGGLPSYNANMCGSLLSDSTSSTSSDEEPPERCRKRKRKWEDFFGRLMTEVIQKQDELQKKFLETLEKRERDRMIREEAWRVQEMAKMNREHDLLVQERSIAAAKDAAVIAFLQKITEQQNFKNPIAPPQLHQIQVQLKENSLPTVPPPPQPVAQPQQQPPPPQQPTPAPALAPAPAPVQSPAPPSVKNMDLALPANNGGEIFLSPSPSRWPKAEVQALIKLRTTLDNKYHESGPKGPLWEEISASMRKLGYNRNAKRCKEKWENINKYYKKVKESNKKRPEDAKTCPYFHQLEALYKEKAKTDGSTNNPFNPGFAIKPENPMVPIMVQPEQQWPLPQQHQDSALEDDHESENLDQNNDDYEEGDNDNDEEEDEDDGARYEIVTNKQPSSVQATAE